MAGARKFLWRAVPVVGLAVALAASALAGPAAASPVLGAVLLAVGLVVLMVVVFAAVYHADVIAHRTGEPYGTLVLTVAVTVIEVALTTLNEVAALPPKLTAVAPVKPAPVIVTAVPPAAEPLFGATEVTAGPPP